MTYQQAGRIAILKRVAGWVLFLVALLSTIISVLSFMFKHSEKQPGIDAVMLDFVHVIVDMLRFNTPFLNVFWHNSPVPEFNGQMNLGFLADLYSDFCSGWRWSRQARGWDVRRVTSKKALRIR
ncbi:Uncharacterised protein [Pantoea agglomerans]|uniref:Uncharacterized protein n=1 Tax=Enterobacter agglomerans TaxID=549 RepID=A0A379AIM2_ENTAG|nr:Uncharacterised protein [Pantoea agglomerans]